MSTGFVKAGVRKTPSGNTAIEIRDGSGRQVSLDAYGRMRMSQPFSTFYSKQTFDTNPDLYVTKFVGGGSVAYSSDRASSDLKTTTANGDKATRQSRRYFNYQPGKSMNVVMTYNFRDAEDNVIKRVGYFDNADGGFIQLTDSALSFVQRSSVTGSPVDSVVEQADWNVDKMDGSGPSRVILDNSKCQILMIDFQWLGVGVMRMGFDIDGIYYAAHEFRAANFVEEIYMHSPNLPVRWEIENDGTAVGIPTISSLCSSVMIEGGVEQIGVSRSADRGIVGATVTNVLRPVLSVRLKSTHNRATVIPKIVRLMSSSGADVYWQLAFNPTITGGTAASWVGVTNSAVEFDIARDGVASGGLVVDCGYMSSNADMAEFDPMDLLYLASDFDGVPDELVVSVSKVSPGSETLFSAIKWLEAA